MEKLEEKLGCRSEKPILKPKTTEQISNSISKRVLVASSTARITLSLGVPTVENYFVYSTFSSEAVSTTTL